MNNSDKIILDLCGGTGAWSKPYKDAGYRVILATLPEVDVRSWMPPTRVYGVLAAPPCTMFSLARQNAKTPRDLRGAMEVVNACLRVIQWCQYDAQYDKKWLQFWAMENPRGLLRKFMGKPALTFEQWQFDPESTHCKPTDIWGNFNMPNFKIKVKPELHDRNYRIGNWQKPPVPKGYEGMGLNRSDIRSITPAGFAEAFFKANQ